MSHHFYVTLPSDSSMNYYPKNTVAHYVTKLSERINLDGECEVGLAEIIYPHSWLNVDNEDKKYWIAMSESGTLSSKTYIKSGFYADETAFAAQLTHQATRSFDNEADLIVKFVYNVTTCKIVIEMKQKSSIRSLALSSALKQFLGFKGTWISIRAAPNIVADDIFELNRGLRLMYVYCDVAAHTAVGDTKAPLLRVCNVTGTHGEVVRITYVHPQYLPLARREFDTIEININDERGLPIPFEFGKSVAVLHFRRRHEETILLRR